MTDAEPSAAEAMDEALFAQLVMMLSQMAAHHLGILGDPEGGAGEVRLDAAQMMIDLLEVLERKTEGRRSDRESRLLTQSLTELRLAYVQVAKSFGAPAPAAAPAAPVAAAEPEAAEPEKAAPSAAASEVVGGAAKPKDDEREPRFHKSYG
jgi:hypothetical protein